MSAWSAAGPVLAAVPVPDGKAGPVALFIIVLLCIACFFIFRSFSKHLKRVPVDFDTTMGTSTEAPVEPKGPDRA
jgi:hypothetical protein